MGDSEWFAQMDYATIVADGDMLWCGISKELPPECATMFPGKFPNAQRFPPVGGFTQTSCNPTDIDSSVHCWWDVGGEGCCEQPTDLDRAKMNNWIFAGYPQ